MLKRPTEEPPWIDTVRRYYDQNTPTFEKYGQGGSAIHRAVWAPNVRTRREAFEYVDARVASDVLPRAAEHGTRRVLDLGCGVGASVIALARRSPDLEVVGVTISSVQAQRATQEIALACLQTRARCIEADFTALPEMLGVFQTAFAIESFVHCPDPRLFFASAASVVPAGGKLILCDDFQARPARSSREQDWLTSIRTGWLASGLCEVGNAEKQAARFGFALVCNEDLTGYLELRRLRDRILSALVAVGRPFCSGRLLWRSWAGGDALQRALVSRLVEYRYLVFERASQIAPVSDGEHSLHE